MRLAKRSPSMLFKISSRLAARVVGNSVVVPCYKWVFAAVITASAVPSIKSQPPAPWL